MFKMVLYQAIIYSVFFVVVHSSMESIADEAIKHNEVMSNDTDEIWCFQCNSAHDKECLDIKPFDTSSTLYRKCPQFDEPKNVTENRKYFCRKIVQTVMTEEVDEKRVIRSCGWVPQDKPCYKVTNPAHKEIVCACHKNACNSATSLHFNFFNFSLVIALLTGVNLFKCI